MNQKKSLSSCESQKAHIKIINRYLGEFVETVLARTQTKKSSAKSSGNNQKPKEKQQHDNNNVQETTQKKKNESNEDQSHKKTFAI